MDGYGIAEWASDFVAKIGIDGFKGTATRSTLVAGCLDINSDCSRRHSDGAGIG